ncbi:MAG TPA: hypothetical protein VEA99_20270, partial [Gemmatimonadaceae bacterium]|nr:hypothetical protein [Gemmatimonadaceae bacterium]
MDHSDRSSRLRPVGLEDEYDLLSELRHGEASSTWLAHERAAHRDVVITIVRPHGLPRRELLAEIGADQQMLAARRTAGVVPVLGLHWLSDGSLAIIRPRVRGTTLAQLLQSTGALPLDRAVGILREIGEQLDWARRIGIRHRELGADSVCFQQGNGRVLLSFGPAPVLGESIDREAPAAAAYEPILSRCSDTATLGRLAWEMLTTRPAPVHGDAGAMSARRGYREPGLADLRPDLPLSVAADVESALRCERDPAPRGPVAFIASLAAAAGQGAAPARGMEPAPHVAPVPSPVLQRHDLQSYAEPSPWTTPVAAAPVVAQPPKRRRRGAVV